MKGEELVKKARKLAGAFSITDGDKFSSVDMQERGFWNQYQDAYEDMIRHTATKQAPWYVVPADNKWFTRTVVATAVIDTLASLNLAYPKVGPDKLKELAVAKRALLNKK